jgi:hypothetical protein
MDATRLSAGETPAALDGLGQFEDNPEIELGGPVESMDVIEEIGVWAALGLILLAGGVYPQLATTPMQPQTGTPCPADVCSAATTSTSTTMVTTTTESTTTTQATQTTSITTTESTTTITPSFPSIVGKVGTFAFLPLGFPYQPHVLRVSGWQLVFYMREFANSSVYASSQDGHTWETHALRLHGFISGKNVALTTNGTTVFYLSQFMSPSDMESYGWGTVNSTGAITWSYQGRFEASEANSHAPHPSLALDGEGDLVAAVSGAKHGQEVWICRAPIESCRWRPLALSVPKAPDFQLVRFPGGVAFVSGTGGASNASEVSISVFDGMYFGVTAFTDGSYSMDLSDCAPLGSALVCAFGDGSSVWSAVFRGGSWVSETKVGSGQVAGLNSEDGTLTMVFTGGAGVYESTSTDGLNWSVPVPVVSSGFHTNKQGVDSLSVSPSGPLAFVWVSSDSEVMFYA